jgi:dienelactone hydrolase
MPRVLERRIVASDVPMTERPLVHAVEAMNRVTQRSDLPYKTAGDHQLTLDVYLPPAVEDPRPAVVFVHGERWDMDRAPEATDWRQYRDWGSLVAASGLAAVTFNHRPSQGYTRLEDPASDIDDLLDVLVNDGGRFLVDGTRLALFGISAGTADTITVLLRRSRPEVRCAVAYYGPLDRRQLRHEVPATVSDEELRDASPVVLLERHPERLAPTLIVRAGADAAWINESIDLFVDSATRLSAAVHLIGYPEGHHAFDLVDDTPRSREVIEATLQFLAEHLET